MTFTTLQLPDVESAVRHRQDYDAILIPGGGSQRTADPGSLPVWTIRRLEAALRVYYGQCGADVASPGAALEVASLTAVQQPAFRGILMPLSGGTTHAPNYTDADGFPVHESTSAALYLQRHGVPAHRIVREYASYDTIGNAYFARVQHCDVAGWRRLLIITSAFHMARTRAIFEWIFALPRDDFDYAQAAGTETDVGPASSPNPYQLHFLEVPDDEMQADVLASRIARERASLASMQVTASRVRSLRALHTWLFSEHKAYATPTQLGRMKDVGLDAVAARSY